MIKWITIFIVLALLAIVIFAYLSADALVESLIRKSLPDHIELKHGDVSTNIFSGSVEINDVDVTINNTMDTIAYSFVNMNSIELKGLSYWQYLVNDKIEIKHIVIRDPITTIYPSLRKSIIDSIQHEDKSLNGKILLDNFEISNGRLVVMNDNLDSVKLSVAKIDLHIYQVSTDAMIQLEAIPIRYEGIQLDMNEMAFTLSKYEKLFVQHATISKNWVEVTDLVIKSTHSKQKMLSLLTEEREHLTIKLPSMIMDSMDFGFDNNVFYLNSKELTIKEADILIHLDKRLKDRTKIKPMYSKMIRELPFTLKIDSTKIINSRVVYEEKHEEGIIAGIVKFDNLNVQVYHISSNSPPGLLTKVYANARMMGESRASIDWKFDIQNRNDEFTLTGKASNFDASSVNKFLNSIYKASLSGHVEQVYFTVAGNDKHSTGDFKMKYRDLKIEVQKDDRSKKNWLKSFIGNAIMNSGKDGDAEGFRHSQISIDRNRHKPFFNFLWLNVKDGALKAIQKNKKRKESKSS